MIWKMGFIFLSGTEGASYESNIPLLWRYPFLRSCCSNTSWPIAKKRATIGTETFLLPHVRSAGTWADRFHKHDRQGQGGPCNLCHGLQKCRCPCGKDTAGVLPTAWSRSGKYSFSLYHPLPKHPTASGGLPFQEGRTGNLGEVFFIARGQAIPG